ncbi:MAG TPA: ElyC/SanA/YdcF family protein [Candidatus Saccharimonadales bacterium]|jgi:vancomycin permeability regulator SanA|nr:ElyC/SanA/YdcF family protein [Candidatus Saccharimonadales bacterium]
MTYEHGKAVGIRHGAWLWRHKLWFVAAGAVGVVLVIGPVVFANITTRHDRFSAANAPRRHVAIVFGAGVEPDGTPTDYLKKRLQTAANLYRTGTVQVLLLSGDNSTSHHNEPVAMRTYIESLGVPEQSTVLDYAGFNTYDTCYRAKAIFGLSDAVLVSHAYHLPRAIMTCDHLGIRSAGVAAENAGQVGRDFSMNYVLREFISTDKAALQIVFKPHPTALGAAQPIR